MSLPSPNLDDKTFEKLVEEAKKRIPIYAPEWTDYNIHDPGISFIELFAWLAEMQLYSLNSITDRHRLKYLYLLGSKPSPASHSKVDIQFTSDDIKQIKAGTPLKAISASSEVIFETEENIEVLPLELKKVWTYSNYNFTDVTQFHKAQKTYYYAFGEHPKKGDALNLGFDSKKELKDLANKMVRLGIYLFEEDLPPAGQHGGEKLKVYPSAEVEWEYWNGAEWKLFNTYLFSWDNVPGNDSKKLLKFLTDELDIGWAENAGISKSDDGRTICISKKENSAKIIIDEEKKKATLKICDGRILDLKVKEENGKLNIYLKRVKEVLRVLSQSVHISFDFPSDIKKGQPPGLTDELLWIRCRVERADYEIPPRIDRIVLNVALTTQGKTEKISVDKSSGLPYQVFNTEKIPIVPESQKITIKGEVWTAVDDFDACKPQDKHYVIDLAKGEIHFGDGIKGSVPPKGAEIKITYRHGGGEKGNVRAGTITQIDVPGVTVTNPYSAYGGKEKESIEEAFVRFRKDLRVHYTAVTAKDYEYIVRSTPGLRVSRARAVVSSENAVTVVVVPFSLFERPTSSEGFKRTVSEHLDMHRLITTYIEVKEPDYVSISVNAEIGIKLGYSPKSVRNRVNEDLNKFLSPIKRKPDDKEWPFGRSVYKSEIYEVIEGVDGVDCVSELFLKGEEGAFKYKNGNIEIGALSLVYPGTHDIEILEPEIACKRGRGL